MFSPASRRLERKPPSPDRSRAGAWCLVAQQAAGSSKPPRPFARRSRVPRRPGRIPAASTMPTSTSCLVCVISCVSAISICLKCQQTGLRDWSTRLKARSRVCGAPLVTVGLGELGVEDLIAADHHETASMTELTSGVDELESRMTATTFAALLDVFRSIVALVKLMIVSDKSPLARADFTVV